MPASSPVPAALIHVLIHPVVSLITLITESSIAALLKLPERKDQCFLNFPMTLKPILLSYTIKIKYLKNEIKIEKIQAEI